VIKVAVLHQHKNFIYVLELVVCDMAAASVNVSLDDIDLSSLRVSPLCVDISRSRSLICMFVC